MLNPNRNTHPMKRMNPDSLMESAKDVGMTGLIALPAAALVGLGAYGASKITYAAEAPSDMLSNDQKRAGVVMLGSLVAGIAMQFSKTTAGVGKAVAVLGVGIPAAMLVQQKVASAMQPSVAAANPLVAASSGMYGLGASMWSPMPSALPSGALPNFQAQFPVPAFVPAMGR